MSKQRDILILLLPALVLALADQVLKWLVRRLMGPLDVIMIIPNIFELSRVENTGSLFGLFPGQQLPLIILSFVIIAIIIYLIFTEKIPSDKLAKICTVLILAGALGNLIDRMFRGSVFDFVDFQIWPVFNLADTMLSGGVAGLLFRELRDSFKRT